MLSNKQRYYIKIRCDVTSNRKYIKEVHKWSTSVYRGLLPGATGDAEHEHSKLWSIKWAMRGIYNCWIVDEAAFFRRVKAIPLQPSQYFQISVLSCRYASCKTSRPHCSVTELDFGFSLLLWYVNERLAQWPLCHQRAMDKICQTPACSNSSTVSARACIKPPQ